MLVCVVGDPNVRGHTSRRGANAMSYDVISEFQIHFSNGNKLFVVFDPANQKFRHYHHILPMNRDDAESVILASCPHLVATHKRCLIDFITSDVDAGCTERKTESSGEE